MITRVPGKYRYRLTSDGLRFAIFYTKANDRLLRPLLAATSRQLHHRYQNIARHIAVHIIETMGQACIPPNAA